MNKKNNLFFVIIIFFAIFVSGCAGSASHKVLTANEKNDSKLDCQGLDREIVKAQAVIDGVNKDKEDISGADVIDGVLWFPFNLIAKNNNYNNALEAADKRIARLNEIKKEKNCKNNTDELKARSATLTEELSKLSKLYKDGSLTEDEYKAAKRKLLAQ